MSGPSPIPHILGARQKAFSPRRHDRLEKPNAFSPASAGNSCHRLGLAQPRFDFVGNFHAQGKKSKRGIRNPPVGNTELLPM